MAKRFFTSESVTSGHPDKVCDLIADSILDEAMRQDPYAHMAVEATIKDDLILVMVKPAQLQRLIMRRLRWVS